MEAVGLFDLLAAGGDAATLCILYVLLKHHTRLTRIETKMEKED